MASLVTFRTLESLQQNGLAEAIYLHGKDIWRLTPRTAQQAAQLLHWAQENGKKVAFSVRDAVLMNDPIWLDYTFLRQVRQHSADDFIIQVEPGITIGQLSELLIEHYQTLPLSYPPEMLLGEVLAFDWPSLETGLKGYPRDFVLKTEIATPDGQLTISGADVVKSVTGYDLHKMYVGARHAFGLITAVTLKLQASPTSSRHWIYTLDSLSAAANLAETLMSHRLPIRTCEVFQEVKDWRVLVESAGEPSLLLDCETNLLAATRPLMPRTISEKAAQSLGQQLQLWPTEQIVLEVAVPPAQCLAMAELLSRKSWLKEYDIKLQMRRAAGLFYFIAPAFSIDILDEFQALATHFQGFMQMMQLPLKQWGDASLMNLPNNSTVQSLLKSLKNGYDPKGVLFTPNMPL